VQGFESSTERAGHIVARTLALQLEMSLPLLYQGEIVMPEMYQFLRGKGFELWDLQPGFGTVEVELAEQAVGGGLVVIQPIRGDEPASRHT
jgi:hypothetical protein